MQTTTFFAPTNVANVARALLLQLAVTCVAVGCEDTNAFSGSKDCSIIRWDVETGKRLHRFKGRRDKSLNPATCGFHTQQVLALAVSSDGRYLASGGADR